VETSKIYIYYNIHNIYVCISIYIYIHIYIYTILSTFRVRRSRSWGWWCRLSESRWWGQVAGYSEIHSCRCSKVGDVRGKNSGHSAAFVVFANAGRCVWRRSCSFILHPAKERVQIPKKKQCSRCDTFSCDTIECNLCKKLFCDKVRTTSQPTCHIFHISA